MPHGWKIIFNSEDVSNKVSRFSIMADLEGYCREMTLDIADPAFYAGLDFSQLPETPEIEIFTKVADEWISQGEFFIERPALDSTVKSDLLQGVWGRSSTAVLGEPFAPKVTQTWPEKTTFFSICQEMCALAGIEWDESYSDIDDFIVYPNTYEVDASYPIDVIAELAGFAGALVTTDRLGHVCLKRIDYSPASEDFTITDADIAEISESPEWPTFGNRVRITPTGSLASYSLTLSIPDPCLPADGATRTKLLSRITDSEGVPVDGLPVKWAVNSADASLDSTVSNTQEILITREEQRASNFFTVKTDFPPSSVDGIWAYADRARKNNLVTAGYTLEGNTITLTDKLAFCDQSLVIAYRSRGIAVNYLQAGTVAEDVTITVDLEGDTAAEMVFVDNPCECPPRLTLKAHPSSIHIGEVSSLLVYVEESGPVTAGRTVFMSEGSAVKRGSLSWTTARLGKVAIANEESNAINEISGVTQCELSMFPASVSSVYRADEDGNPIGGNLYASHDGKVIDLNTTMATGTALLANYTALGAALNRFTAETLGTARIDAYIRTTREEPTEASVRISVIDESKAIDDYPEEWAPEEEGQEEEEYGGSGGDDEEFDTEADSIDQAPFNWCVPENVSSDPSTVNLQSRFTPALEHDCDCQTICQAEFEIFGTTQNYDGASMRDISDIVVEDHALTEGTPEYWEKFNELKTAALEDCVAQCNAASLTWDPENPETINQNDEISVSVIGGLSPFTWSITGEDVELSSPTTSGRTNTLSSGPTACGAFNITVTDSVGNTCSGVVRCTQGSWVQCYDFHCINKCSDSVYFYGVTGGHLVLAKGCGRDSACSATEVTGVCSYDGFSYSFPAESLGYKAVKDLEISYWSC